MANATELQDADYINILQYYHKPIPHSRRILKLHAEKIMASKLCKCINKLQPQMGGPLAIGTCTKTVFTRKGYSRGKFKCTNRQTVKLTKRRQQRRRIRRGIRRQ